MGERAQPLQGTAPSWRLKVPCCDYRRFADGILADVRTPGGPTGVAPPLLMGWTGCFSQQVSLQRPKPSTPKEECTGTHYGRIGFQDCVDSHANRQAYLLRCRFCYRCKGV